MSQLKWIKDRAFSHYKNWECWKNGMYESREDQKFIDKSRLILGDDTRFRKICKQIIEEWPVSSTVHLSDASINRKAYLGAAACSFGEGATERETRLAWGTLSTATQDAANNVAMEAIRLWLSENILLGIYQTPKNQLVFPFLMRPEKGYKPHLIGAREFT